MAMFSFFVHSCHVVVVVGSVENCRIEKSIPCFVKPCANQRYGHSKSYFPRILLREFLTTKRVRLKSQMFQLHYL